MKEQQKSELEKKSQKLSEFRNELEIKGKKIRKCIQRRRTTGLNKYLFHLRKFEGKKEDIF